MIRRLATILPILAALGVLAASSTAQAQDTAPTWRRRTGPQPKSTLGNFTVELRFGGYYPQVDDEFGGSGPFTQFFGKGPQFYFGLEADWMPIEIPYVGRLGPAFGWGYATMSAKAKLPTTDIASGAATTETVGVSTNLNIHAMHVSAVLRIDEIKKRIVIPIVPYAKIGFGMGTWSSGTSTGGSKVGDCEATTPTNCVTAEGLSIGPHIAVGGMLGLNWLDRRSGTMARESTGIDQAYLFGEWMLDKLDSGVGKDPMHVGTSSWVLGIALDL